MAAPTVCTSGIVLASMMFEHLNRDSDAEGFILGESKEEERNVIIDSDIDHIYLEHRINIQKHVTCHKLNNFYNGAGEVNLDLIRNILSDNKQEHVIGWYRQRRNTGPQMTFRERIVHENLKRALAKPDMIFFLTTPSETTASGSTHRMEYAVFKSQDGLFHNIPVLITNLGSLEEQVYLRSSAPISAAGYNRVLQKHKSNFFSVDGSLQEVDKVGEMNNSMQAELHEACRNVEKSERQVQTLRAEVRAIQKRILKRKQHAEEKGVAEIVPRRNLLLRRELRKLFPRSPLLRTQTLTFEGVPVADPPQLQG